MPSEQARYFNPKQRRYLSILSGGVCCLCGSELHGVFHADHIQAYAKGGATLLGNGQTLCPSCNLKKGVASHAAAVKKLATRSS